MKINHLELKQFRNINMASLDFHEHLNIFVGENGQGKTNIVESIVFLSSGRSFRVFDDQLMIQDNQDYSKIEAVIENKSIKETLSIVLSHEGKYLKYNQKVLSKLSEFIGLCNVVLFNPDDLQFYTQAPKKRRREIDYEIGKSSSDYVMNLSKVNALITERNAYLKKLAVENEFLDVLDEQISHYSKFVIEKRRNFINAISKGTEKVYQELMHTKDSIDLEYVSSIDMNDLDYENSLLEKLKESRSRDIQFKMTHVGIQRDDYVFKINDRPVIHILSQGQRRILMIAYKIAVIHWFIEEMGSVPIFCMDDLFSELDENKRGEVLSCLNPKVQVFITTTDLNFIKTDKDKHIFVVSEGNIRKEEEVA